MKPVLLLALGILAVASALPTYSKHVLARLDEATCVVALVTIGTLALLRVAQHRLNHTTCQRASTSTRGASLGVAAALALAYGLLAPVVPPILRLALAILVPMAVLSVVLWGRTLQLGLFGLALISLPQVDGLRTLLGYPLRVAVGRASLPILRLYGYPVELEGTGLVTGNQTIWVDAPCSGIQMLSIGGLLASGLVLAYNLAPWRALAVASASCALLFAANVMRTVSLFHLEVQGLAGERIHAAIGLSSFALAAIMIVVIVSWAKSHSSTSFSVLAPVRHVKSFVFAAVVSGGLGFVLHPSDALESGLNVNMEFPGWPTQLRGEALTQIPLSDGERAFAEDFPGHMARFKAGDAQVILRWVTRVTRQVHSSDVCYRAAGFSIYDRMIEREGGTEESIDGVTHGVTHGVTERWSTFRAEKNGEHHLVRERIRDEQGRQWTDLSSWLWQAGVGKLDGPWWSEVWIEPGTGGSAAVEFSATP